MLAMLKLGGGGLAQPVLRYNTFLYSCFPHSLMSNLDVTVTFLIACLGLNLGGGALTVKFDRATWQFLKIRP